MAGFYRSRGLLAGLAVAAIVVACATDQETTSPRLDARSPRKATHSAIPSPGNGYGVVVLPLHGDDSLAARVQELQPSWVTVSFFNRDPAADADDHFTVDAATNVGAHVLGKMLDTTAHGDVLAAMVA